MYDAFSSRFSATALVKEYFHLFWPQIRSDFLVFSGVVIKFSLSIALAKFVIL